MDTVELFHRTLADYGLSDAIAAGVAWYPDALEMCNYKAYRYSLSTARVAALVAVTSPRARWSTNISAVESILEDSRRPLSARRAHYGILGANAAKGARIVSEWDYNYLITGPKVTAFYRAILGDSNSVTVDAIMSRAAGYGASVTVKIRRTVEAATREVAHDLGLSPRDAQAAIWVAYRGSAA